MAFMPHDEDTLNRRFPGLRFERLKYRAAATIERESGYALSRSSDGRAATLTRRNPAGALLEAPVDIPIVEARGRIQGSLDSAAAVPQPLGGDSDTGFALSGWAFGADRGRVVDIVAFTDDAMAPSDRVHLTVRPDVAAVVGAAAERPGFVLDARADSGDVARSGFMVFALFEDGTASRLAFRYLPIESDWTGRETLPVSDGRRLPIVPPLP